MNLRPARPSDAARVHILMEQLGYSVASEEIARRIARRGDDREVFVAEHDADVVGWAAVCIGEGFVEGRLAWIEGLVVAEGGRSAGTGARLLDAVETWARERGCEAMRVQSNVIRERAHTFYERNGYAKLKAQFAFRKQL